MLNEIEYPESGEYRSGSNWEPIVFFLDSLLESHRFDLLLGYFSSSAINVLSLGFAKFISSGGKLRMIANHIFSARDRESILKGQITDESIFNFAAGDIKGLKASLDDYGVHFFECLAWLISSKRIEIKAVKPKLGHGIAHYKSGLFSDGKNTVRFKSSCNFTASGLLENLEELDIRCSWDSSRDVAAITEYQEYFENLFYKRADFAEYIPMEEAEVAIYDEFGDKSLSELLVQEQQLLAKKLRQTQKPHFVKAIEKAQNYIQKYLSEPRFPYESGPRSYQSEAYQNWVNNDYKGIFAMATGTGKTLTALNCVLKEFRKVEAYRAIIVVPTIELVSQWKQEIEKFRFKNIVSVSSANNNWRNDLRRIITLSKSNSKYSFFIVTTYRSFTSTRFQSALYDLPTNTIFIADEAHNCGSPMVSTLLPDISLEKRIGLSATPERVYDPEGTQIVDDFFDDARPYTYEFSMEKALDQDYLCKYYYYPYLVELTEEELKDYVDISVRLAKFYNSEDAEISSKAEDLLLIRKQIIHKANNKIHKFDELVLELSKKDKLKHMLVYAPEGYFREHFNEVESLENLNVEENRICEFYSSRIRTLSPKTKVTLFNAGTKNRKFILDQFSETEIDVLVSMKCLDEGVDVPRTETAIFCASTGNPRQFIQRRGRILRNHKEKRFAYIYDLVVVPSLSRRVGSFQIEKKLIKNELRRVNEFAGLALNRFEALERVRHVTKMYDINQPI